MMIVADKLTKFFAGRCAVDNFCCNIDKAKIVGLVGANGAGKTTIMRMLTGYLPPTSGCAIICGYDVFLHRYQARMQVGYLPENLPLYPDMRVKEYLYYVATLQRTPIGTRRRNIERVVELCKLRAVCAKKIAHISRGYRQRTALAQALVADPPVLVVDEPTSALDPLQIQETRNLFRTLCQEKTILLSTHVLSEVEQICTDVIILQQGRIKLSGSLSALLQPDKIILAVIAPPQLAISKFMNIQGIKSVDYLHDGDFCITTHANCDPRQDIWEICYEHHWPIRKLDYGNNTLEDIYRQITL